METSSLAPRYYSANGGAFINSGTYGCAFDPPIDCHRKNMSYPPGVKLIGKIFSDTKAFKAELEVVKLIQAFDKYHRYTVPFYGHCQIHQSKFKPSDEAYRCSEHVTTYKKTYPQIIYQYGGIDLKEYYTKSSTYPIKLYDFLALFYPLLEGIQNIHVKSYAHADIKPSNLLIDPVIPKVYLIDFGLITSLSKMSKEDYLLRHDYPYYPPEFKILYALKQGTPTLPNEVYETCLKNFNYYGRSQFMFWLRSRWPTYTSELQALVDKCMRLSETEMENYFNRQTIHTIDSYGLAMTLIEIIFHMMNRRTLQYSNKLRASRLEIFLKTILFPMIRPDPDTRMTVAEALPLYAAFFSVPAAPVAAPVAPAPPAPPVPISLHKCKTLPRDEIVKRLEYFKQTAQGTTETELCLQLLNYYQSKYPQNKQLQQCYLPESKGGIPYGSLRKIAKALGIPHTKKQDICKSLIDLAN